MSGGVFLLPYTPSWHGKRHLYVYIKVFPPCFQPATVGTVHFYNRVKRRAESSAQVMAYRVLSFHGSTYSSLRFRDHTQTPTHTVRLLLTSGGSVAQTYA